MKMNADVAVIGLGTMGSMTAWHLARRGLSVLGFEQFGIGHDRSAYGGGSRRFRIASPYVAETPFTSASYRKFRELEQETGKQLLSSSGALTIGDPNSQHIKDVLTSAEKFNVSHEIYNENEAMSRYPQHKLTPGEIMIWEKTGGVLRPEQIVISAVNRAQLLGADIHTYTPVKEIQSDANGVTIHTETDTYRVGKVVITTGAWANKLVPSLTKSFAAQRLILTWFIPETPEQFVESKFPNFTRLTDEIHIQGTPALDGRMVRVTNNSKSVSEAKLKVEDADHFDKNVSVEYALSIGEQVQKLIPNLHPDPVQISPFMEGFSADGLPIVGSLQEDQNTILVCGFSGQGFSQAPVMGEIAADLAINNETDYDIGHLSPNRFGLLDIASTNEKSTV